MPARLEEIAFAKVQSRKRPVQARRVLTVADQFVIAGQRILTTVQRLGHAGFEPQISSLGPGCVGRPARFGPERIPSLVVTSQVQTGFSETPSHHGMIYSVFQEFPSQ